MTTVQWRSNLTILAAVVLMATGLTLAFAAPGAGAQPVAPAHGDGGGKAPAARNGDNGTVKIHNSTTPVTDPRNEPHVCIFYLDAFGFDPAQSVSWQIKSWPHPPIGGPQAAPVRGSQHRTTPSAPPDTTTRLPPGSSAAASDQTPPRCAAQGSPRRMPRTGSHRCRHPSRLPVTATGPSSVSAAAIGPVPTAPGCDQSLAGPPTGVPLARSHRHRS